MSFEVEFQVFNSLKRKVELLLVAQQYKLSSMSSMGKGEAEKIVLSHLTEEEFSEELH